MEVRKARNRKHKREEQQKLAGRQDIQRGEDTGKRDR